MRRMLFTFSLAILLIGLAYRQLIVSGQAIPEEFDLERIQSATVFVMQVQNVNDDLFVTCTGSGTIVSRDGLVLTNAHNTLQSESCPGETIVIALSLDPEQPPVPEYRAQIVQSNTGLDLALLRITQQFDGRLIEPGTLALPFVELGDSSAAQLDETLIVVGYPGIGNDPVSVVRGTISSFTAEPSGGDKSWIKTSASIPGMMSGGGAYNRLGQLVGIPTTAPITAQAAEGNCVPIQDTNRDGLVTNSDICIPVGGFINSLRPSDFARPLLRAASLGLTVDRISEGRIQTAVTGDPTFRDLFFSPSVTNGIATTVIGSLPTGSDSLFLFFDYENMTPETIYEVAVTINGIPDPTFSLAPIRWSGGERGLWYVGSRGQVFPNGVYEYTLFINGVAAGSKQILVGGAAEPTPTFSDIVFGLEDQQGNIVGNGAVLPTGNIASANFIYNNLADGTEWTQVWFYEGIELSRISTAWDLGASGAHSIRVEAPDGLQPGNYRLRLYIEGRLAATADFTIAGAQIVGGLPQIFSDQHFTTASTPEEAITATEINNFPTTVPSLYTLFDWSQISRGTLWTMRWTVDGDVFYEQTLPWGNAESGENYLTRLTGSNDVPDGTYQMTLLVGGVPIVDTEAQVGIGQLPIDLFASPEGIQLSGRITDSQTREGIPDATFVLISEDFSIEDFEWRQDQIYALAITDRNGFFQIDRPLQLAVPYSVMIVADGYLPISADGFELEPDTANPLFLPIELTRD